MSKAVNRIERSDISALPIEIISYIFRFLPVSDIKCAALVCCAWSRAAEDPILWRNAFISLGTRRERFSNVLVDSLQRHGIQYLKFKHMSTAAQIMQVCKQLGPNLKTLSLQGCRCVNTSLLEFLSNCCPNIHHLDLSRCRQLDMTKDASWLNDCAIVWRHLTVLDLNACKDISNFLVSKIADTLPMIVNLSISGCKGITPSIWERLVRKVPSLKFLDISRSDMTDETMLKFSQLPQLNLKGINLTACKQLTDSGLVSFIKYQNSVEILKLACMDITNTTLICIGKHMEHLRVLDLNSCRQLTDAAVSRVKSLLVNLESLNLYSCYQLSNIGLSQFLCGLQEINQDIPLRVLVLNGCSSLSDELVSRFSTVLLNLQELDVSSCLHVTDIGLNSITDSLVQLQSLRLSWCINITDNGLLGVVQEQKPAQGMKINQSKKARQGKKVSLRSYQGKGNENENKHLRNADHFVIIGSSSHSLLLTEHAANGLVEALLL